MPFPVAAGQIVDAADINFLNEVPAGRISISAAKSIANATVTQVDFDVTDYVSGITADLAGNRLIVITPGIYLVTLYLAWAVGNTGTRFLSIRKNALDQVRDRRIPRDESEAAVTTAISLVADDNINVNVYQTNGAALNLVTCVLTATYQRRLP
ncbi:MAG: hypothetical protein M3O70_12350 [Actinomycetota bacterium]|nr:hypothetical protein [Actinomycetota bacterium]